MPHITLSRKRLILLAIIALAGVGGWVYAARNAAPTVTRVGYADENYLPSTACRNCHAAQYSSWRATHHSRMTQEATPDAVLGDFTRDNTLEYLGVKATMTRHGGEFFMSLAFPDGRTQESKIARTIGSRRIQQYLVKERGQYTRLPVAYDLVNRRWMHLNGSFFHSDSDNYFQHQTQWDSNCVFCHNVKAQPHLNFQTKEFQTETAELGIACGACHGATAAHIASASSLAVRWGLRSKAEAREKVVFPPELTPERSVMVCGHCHGQRVPEPVARIADIITKGDPFNAGEDLRLYYKPVTRETRLGNVTFANRFWQNGSPRLTAFEYQGLTRSACYLKAAPENKITCLNCHTMHGGDPRGQLETENRTDTPCLKCHQQLSDKISLAAHTKHDINGSGSRCYNCHMPRVVFGVMAFHPTHEITVPQPALTATQNVPNACNLCHLDKSVNWSIAATKKFWAQRYAATQPSKDRQFDEVEGVRLMFAGDALMRALAADALSGGVDDERGDAAIANEFDARRTFIKQSDARWAAPYLTLAAEDDYPIVRYFAAQGLQIYFPASHGFDYLADADRRAAALRQYAGLLNANTLHRAQQTAMQLKSRRAETDVEVGE